MSDDTKKNPAEEPKENQQEETAENENQADAKTEAKTEENVEGMAEAEGSSTEKELNTSPEEEKTEKAKEQIEKAEDGGVKEETIAEKQSKEDPKKDVTPVAEEEPADNKEGQSEGDASSENDPNGSHDEFDWDADKRNILTYPKEERVELEQMYEDTLSTVEDNTIVKGIVMRVTDSDVILNIGFKSDGLVPASEFRDMEVNQGDEVEVYVEKKEDARGQLQLSRRKAKLMRAWETIVDAHENDKVIEGKIVSKTKGGLIVNCFGLETFLPGSQIDVKPIIDYDAYVGKKMEFKVVKINEAIKNAVVSHKALIESDIEEQRQAIISQLEKGQVLEGTIKNLTDFGAFIDLGGVDGLLYITDISWGRINHPSEVLELNQQVNVVVLDFDDEKKRISLGLKQLEKHPWDVLDEKISEGSKVKGKIVNIEDYGAFLEITPGVEGLIHVSEVSWSNQPINAKEYFNIEDEHEAIVVTIDREDRKMSLSIKQLMPDPWENVEDQYPVGSRHTGEVKNITPYGVFVELDEYIGGMVHISDLSWIKRFNHPSEFTRVGDQLEVIVLEIDKESRKLSLGHKQIEEDPWDTFESVFPIGSEHEGTLVKKDDKGGIVSLPYGLEAFAPMKHLKKEDGTQVEVDQMTDFKILEFDRDDKRIIVSHTRVYSDKKLEADEQVKREKQQQTKQTKQTIKKIKRQQERTTLGDLGVLGDLKGQMEEAEKKGGEGKSSSKKKTKETGDEENKEEKE